MVLANAWSRLEAEARDGAFEDGRFRLLAYSEFMPAPYIRLRPYEAQRQPALGTSPSRHCEPVLDISE